MPPINLLIKPASSLCNMRCKYCFYADVSSCREVESFGIMDEETLEILVKKSLRYATGQCGFAFQGGEPTLAGLGFFRKLIEFEKKYNASGIAISNSIQTNGYIIDEEWAEFLSVNNFLVGLSLDGPQEVHDSVRVDAEGKGTFERIMHTVELFNRYNVEYNILTVVSNCVAKNAKKVYNFFKKNDFRYLQYIQCLDPFDNDPRWYSLTSQDYETFLKATFDEYYKDFKHGHFRSVRTFDNYITMIAGVRPESCGMSGVCTSYFVVEGNGNVYPCDFYVLDKYLMGNIRENSFEEMRKSEPSVNFVEESRYVMPQCRECKWLNICRGGCRRHREPFIDGKPGLNRFCEAYKGFFNYTYKRMEEIADAFRRNAIK